MTNEKLASALYLKDEISNAEQSIKTAGEIAEQMNNVRQGFGALSVVFYNEHYSDLGKRVITISDPVFARDLLELVTAFYTDAAARDRALFDKL